MEENMFDSLKNQVKSIDEMYDEKKEKISTVDLKELDLKDESLCFHVSQKAFEESIENGEEVDGKIVNGLHAKIGMNSKGELGHEKTEKVFFTKGINGFLMYINRTMNIMYDMVDKDIVDKLPNEYENLKNIYLSKTKENMTAEEKEEIVMDLAEEYFNNAICYSLNLNGADITREEYDKLSKEEQDRLDYITYDYNEEKNGQYHSINNMHTLSQKGVAKDKLTKLVVEGKDDVTSIITYMADKYKEMYSVENVPTVDRLDEKDMVSKFTDRIKEKEKNRETIE